MHTLLEAPPGFQLVAPATPMPIRVPPPPPPPRTSTDGEYDDEGYLAILAAIARDNALRLFSRCSEDREAAEAWFTSPDARGPEAAGGITFGWICESHGVDQDWLASKLRQWAEQRVSRRKAKP